MNVIGTAFGTEQGGESHKTSYLNGTVRVDGNRLIIGLPDGPVVNRYRPTNKLQAVCA